MSERLQQHPLQPPWQRRAASAVQLVLRVGFDNSDSSSEQVQQQYGGGRPGARMRNGDGSNGYQSGTAAASKVRQVAAVVVGQIVLWLCRQAFFVCQSSRQVLLVCQCCCRHSVGGVGCSDNCGRGLTEQAACEMSRGC